MGPNQISALRFQISRLLSDKCVDFINNLISKVIGKPYNSKKQLLKDFDRVSNGKGGFFFKEGGVKGGNQTGNLNDGTARINILGHDITMENSAIPALHELIHAIADADDPTLAKAVRDLGITVYDYPSKSGEGISSYPENEPDDRNGKFGGYWGQALKNACSERGY
jgi:hypothetical protein